MSDNSEIYKETVKMNKELYAFIYPESKNSGREMETISIGKGGGEIPEGIRRILSKVRERLGISEGMISTEDLSKMGENLYEINSGEEITKAEIVAQAFHQFLELFGADRAVSTELLKLVNKEMTEVLEIHYLKRTAYIADKPNAKSKGMTAVKKKQTTAVQYWGLVNYVLCAAYYSKPRPAIYHFTPGSKERTKTRVGVMYLCLPESFKNLEHEMVSSASNQFIKTNIKCTHLSKTVLQVITLLACIELRKRGYSMKEDAQSTGGIGATGGIKRKANAL